MIQQSDGFDFWSAYDYTIESYGELLIKTYLAVKIAYACYGRVAPSSGLSLIYHIEVISLPPQWFIKTTGVI